MGPKKFVGPHMTTEKVYGWLDLKIFLEKISIFSKSARIKTITDQQLKD